MKSLFTIGLAGCLLAVPHLYAGESEGFYIGAGYGSTGYYDDDMIDDWVGVEEDDDDTGHKLYAGYQLNKIVGIEASYTEYGKFRSTVQDQEYKAAHIAANVGYSFLGGQLRPFALIGLGKIDHDATNTAVAVDMDDIDFSYYFGYGFQYEPKGMQGFGLRVGYDADVFNREVTRLGIAEDYSQIVSLWYVALQFRF